ncbi:MAG: hypothetical protein E7168_02380 [Firmicutes bacterium]|nr:hypothetical protein [Bacillota bacterium]
MKKYSILVFLIIIILFFTGCKNKLNDQIENNKNENTQITDKDSKTDEMQSVDDTTNNKDSDKNETNNGASDNTNNQGNSNSDGLSDKNENNNSSSNLNNNTSTNNNSSSSLNGNTSTNNNSNSNNVFSDESNTVSEIVEPTIEYTCDSSDAYIKDGKCVRSYTYAGTLAFDEPYSCPSGYIYKLGKCYIMKNPNEVKYCENSLAKMEGDFCVEGAPYEALKGSGYNTWSIGYPHSIYDEESYVDYAQINCPANSVKTIDDNSKKSYCLDSDRNVVSPLKAICSRDSEVIKNENGYYCSGIKYYYYYCGQNHRIEGTTCTPGVSVRWGMYCDDNSEVQNGKCHYVTDVEPIGNYTCRNGDKKVDGSLDTCVHEDISDLKVTYKCSNGYSLTSDEKCKLN